MRRFYWTGTEGLWKCRTSCIIYERRLILRLNICWFVKSTNRRSRSHPDVSERPAPNPPAHLIDENISCATRTAWRRRRRRRGGERSGMKVSFQERRLFISVCFSLCAFSPQTANERVKRDGDAHSTHVLYETTRQSIKNTFVQIQITISDLWLWNFCSYNVNWEIWLKVPHYDILSSFIYIAHLKTV